MKCNRDRLHCQFNRNQRLLSRLNLEIFTLRHCAMNRGCSGWVPPLSSFVMVMIQGRLFSRLCVLNPDSAVASTALCSSYPSSWPPEVTLRVQWDVTTKRRALLKNELTLSILLPLRQQNSGTFPGEVLVLFMFIQRQLMNVSAGVAYVSTVIYIQ